MLRHEATRETLLEAGGRYDLIDRRFLDEEPETCKYVDVHDGQAPFIRWLATWLPDFRDGHERGTERQVLDRAVLAESGRRAGKTFALQAGQAAVAVDVPRIGHSPLICWIVSKSHEEEEELKDNVPAILPGHWYRWRERLHRYELAHGSYIALISSDRPQTTKRGKVDIALVNEAQKQRQSALTNLIYGTADRGGCTWLAANPNDSLSGEWVSRLREKILAGELPRTRSFYFDPSKNVFIDQAARADIDAIVREIDPAQAARDGGGEWLPVGDRTYYDFRKRPTKTATEERQSNVAPVPEVGLPDVTREVTRRRLGRAYDYVAGHDPNGKPHMAGVVGKFFGKVDDPILWILEEMIVEGHEDEFLDYVDERGYRTDNTHWILDGSSYWQGTERKQGVYTVDFFKARGWVTRGPEEKKSPKGTRAANPRPAARRYGRTNHLLRAGRTMIVPTCEWLIESLVECLWRRTPSGGIAYGRHTHVTDALGYLQWFWFPRPQAPQKPVDKHFESITVTRRQVW